MSKRRTVLLALNIALAAAVSLSISLPEPLLSYSTGESRAAGVQLEAPVVRQTPPPSLDRPVFRTAFVAASAPAGEIAMPEIRLVGVLLAEDARIAFIEQAGASLKRVGEGDEVDGWAVTSVDSHALTLSNQNRIAVYKLDSDSEQ
ncbi:hypothetical protein [Microvirga terricola]|uniref:General secretion pathway protein GspC n=1 Tax=Microvirga terricola TaxID=2719797 RepID=A0ABX0VGL1_9HYPH|nr:hypothetical protein [Microvirga terricola]NIX78439.1 hypothetical protein [Microvirga terricola]